MAENTFDRFSVFFTGDTVFLDGAAFPLGQLTTDVLNLDGEVLTEIDRRVNHFMSTVWALLQEKTDSAARSAQTAKIATQQLAAFIRQDPSRHVKPMIQARVGIQIV